MLLGSLNHEWTRIDPNRCSSGFPARDLSCCVPGNDPNTSGVQTANFWGFRNSYTWDKLNRVDDMKQESASNPTAATWSAAASTTRFVGLNYRADSSLQTISRTQATTGTTPIVTTVSQTSDGQKNEGRLASITHSGLNGLNTSYSYTYDDQGRVATFTTLSGTRTYSYDSFDQLTGATGGSQAAETYSYDTNGNRTGAGVTTSAYNRVTNDGTYTYQYDNEGNRTRRTKISTGDYELYAWDYRQRLTSVTLKNSAGVTQKTTTYEYDGLDRRIRRTVSNAAGTVTEKQRFLFDSNVTDGSTAEVVLVLDELASGLPYQEVDHRFMNGPAIDQVFADEGSGSGNQVLWYLSDSQNTVRDVAQYSATTAGATAQIRNHLEYDAFGNVTSADDPTTTGNPSDGDLPGLEGTGNEYSPQRSYTGREPDSATGLIYYRARWYDPTLGRFISEDPMGFSAGDANLSRYVGNSTTNAIDPSGLDAEELVVNWHHLFPQQYEKQLQKWGISSRFLNSPENGWYLLAEDHWKLHSDTGTTEWNKDWKLWVDSRKGKTTTESHVLEQIEVMKRKHGLVEMNGTPRMGKSVADVDYMPYDEWNKGDKARTEWRKANRTCNGYAASKAETARVQNDYKLRKAKTPVGTMPARGYTKELAEARAKVAVKEMMPSRRAMKLLTTMLVATGALEEGKNAFAGVLALNDPEARNEFVSAMEGLIQHQQNPHSRGLMDAHDALFGPYDWRNSPALLQEKPKGVITKILAAHAQAEEVNWYVVAPIYLQLQESFSERVANMHQLMELPK